MSRTGKDKKLATFNIGGDTWIAFQEKARANGHSAAGLLKSWIEDYLDRDIPDDSGKLPGLTLAERDDLASAIAPRIKEDVAVLVQAAVESRLADLMEIYLDANLETAIARLEDKRSRRMR